MENIRNTRILIRVLLLIILGLLLNNCTDFFSEKVEAPPQSISIDQARTLQRTFVRTRSGIINEALGFGDTRDFWFSLDSLENYFRYVRSESKKQGLEDLGIRIYYAAYPKESKEKWPDSGFSTVILVPTYGKPQIGNGFFPAPPVQSNSSLRAYNYGQGGDPPNDL